MGLIAAIYSPDPDVFDIISAKAGDAAEMEAKLNAILVAGASPPNVIDYVLAGVGQGPEWETAIVFAVAGGTEPARELVRFFAGVGGSPEEALAALYRRIANQNDLRKVEVAGGGSGTTFMALALVDAVF